MKIPKVVKINGIPYKITRDEKFYAGNYNEYAGEFFDTKQIINIRPDMSDDITNVSLLHECIHGMLFSLGYDEHDEQLVDGLAYQLYMLIKDNPKMFGGD